MNCNTARRKGFTLVELLVVIGIIALLISILLPTLSSARESANAVKCASNMRQAATAMNIYANENHGWLAGPHTSGQWLNYAPFWSTNIGTTLAGFVNDKKNPVQNMDWMSPTLGLVLDDLPDNDLERLFRLFNTDMECPTVSQEFTDTFPSGSLPGPLRYTSYAAIVQFHAFPILDDTTNNGTYSTGTGDRVGIYGDLSSGGSPYRGVRLNRGYSPKLTSVGAGASKAYVVEGGRFVSTDSTGNSLTGTTFNLFRHQQSSGGNFMVAGPYRYFFNAPHRLPLATADNWSGGDPTEVSKGLGWRHGNTTMNIAFFDGHVEKLPPAESISPQLYFPSGATVTDATRTYEPNDTAPYEIQ